MSLELIVFTPSVEALLNNSVENNSPEPERHSFDGGEL
jgi:hypothetical protein